MPVAAVKYEDLWLRAKSIVGSEYKGVKTDSPKYWKLVMGIYRKMETERDAKR
jgi:hypothetical protein